MRLKFLTLLSTVLLLVSVSTVPVKADGGFAIGAVINFGSFDTDGKEREGNASNTNSATEEEGTTKSEAKNFGSIFIEYAGRGEHFGLTGGIEYIPGTAKLGSGTRSDTANDALETGGDTATYTAKAEISNHWSIYLEPTAYLGGLGLYAKAGLSKVTVKSLESLATGTDSSTYDDADVVGTLFGFGVRATAANGMFLKIDHSITDYGVIALESTTGNKNKITASPDQKSTRISIGYQF